MAPLALSALKKHPLFGLCLAGFGALTLTPDSLFIRLSDMGAFEMLVWRGIQMGLVMFLLSYLMDRKNFSHNLRLTYSKRGLVVCLCQFISTACFVIGIAQTSVSVILFALATSPIFAAFFSHLILQERTHISTWLATILTLFGIVLTVFDASHAQGAPDGSVVLGAICGLTASAAIGMNFVLFRKYTDLPVAPITGNGSLLSGLVALAYIGPWTLFDGNVWMISVCGLLILPVSFFCLTSASRYTAAANIGLLMLLETILGPVWVWIGVGEGATMQMVFGGVIVIVTLAVYVIYTSMRLKSDS
ncbi:MAG: DMT family transporter [Candidatus Puniceispirillaceae bacterium]